MNERILHKDVQDFIDQNLNSDLTKLILKGSPFPNIAIQEIASQIVTKQKSKKKLPTWFATKNIYYPPKINLEQTSSEITAAYKANSVTGNTLIDITGGFGVDCFAFSKKFKQITHCEINTSLSQIASHNFEELGIQNIKTIANDGIGYLQETQERFDCIYTDPSRRNDVKGKVFLLKDCEPNVPHNLEFLFSKSKTILIKTSPILDIKSAIGELSFVKEVHVVAIDNEVKELLFLLEHDFNGSIDIKTINFSKKQMQQFDFVFNSDKKSTYGLPQNYLYEPNTAILKSGGFHEVSSKFNVKKLHQHSHLYTCESHVEFPGRSFKIVKSFSFDKKNIKKELKLKKANITTRNFPKKVDQLRRELKIKDGGFDYLFFTTDYNEQLICILCHKI